MCQIEIFQIQPILFRQENKNPESTPYKINFIWRLKITSDIFLLQKTAKSCILSVILKKWFFFAFECILVYTVLAEQQQQLEKLTEYS